MITDDQIDLHILDLYCLGAIPSEIAARTGRDLAYVCELIADVTEDAARDGVTLRVVN